MAKDKWHQISDNAHHTVFVNKEYLNDDGSDLHELEEMRVLKQPLPKFDYSKDIIEPLAELLRKKVNP